MCGVMTERVEIDQGNGVVNKQMRATAASVLLALIMVGIYLIAIYKR